MSFPKSKNESYYVGGRHRSATKKNVFGDITFNGSKAIIAYCSNFIGKIFLTVSDIQNKLKFLKTFTRF